MLAPHAIFHNLITALAQRAHVRGRPRLTAILKVKGQSTECEYGGLSIDSTIYGLRNMAATGE